MRKYTEVTTVRISEETKADMSLLKKNHINPSDITREAIEKAVKDAAKKFKKSS